MIYRKNIHQWEQIIRLAAGIALAIYGCTAMASTSIGYMLIIGGLFMALSGIFGFCPACLLVGRKLRRRRQ